MIDLTKKNEHPENSESLGKAIRLLIEENLDFERWKFKLEFYDFSKMSSQKLVYDSPFCRIRFSFSRGRWPKNDELRILYGRLHAPIGETFLEWQKVQCHCWHRLLMPLRFLDGLSPQEAVNQSKIKKNPPNVIDDYRKSDEGSELLDEYPPKYVLSSQSVVWKNYGQRLFDLFDLRKPELWDQYKRFLQEYYQITGEKSLYGPPYENVC